MPTKKDAPTSQYDLFRGKLTFTTEPLWFRLVVITLILAAVVAIIAVIRWYALPAMGARWLSGIKMPGGLKWINSHSP